MNPINTDGTTASTGHKFPWITTTAKAALFMLKSRVKAPRVVPAPSTGDPATDEVTRREFERVREQLNADYQDQRAMLNDLEPLLFELADQLQGWMAQREEQMMRMMMLAARGGAVSLPGGFSAPALPSSGGVPALPAATGQPGDFYGGQSAAQYEGQLIKGDGTDAIYRIEGGRKRWITSADAFNRAGFKWEQVRVIPKQIVDAIPFGSNIG
jgi:hypothetical protein